MEHYYVHNWSPFAIKFQLGPLQGISWYGLMYVLGFTAGYFLLEYLRRHEFLPLKSSALTQDLLTYCIAGAVLGGRLGHVLFYNPPYYLSHPFEILAVWHGGMASHGGILGLVLGLLWFSRKQRVPFLALCDSAALAATPGLFFGRFGNFINGEMPGKVTDVAWAVIFAGNPEAGTAPRHPVQIYQALTEGLILFLILWFIVPRARFKRGFHTAIFLIGYAVLRIGTEFFRETSDELASIFGAWPTQGQLLSLGMILCGLWVYYHTQFALPKNTAPVWK